MVFVSWASVQELVVLVPVTVELIAPHAIALPATVPPLILYYVWPGSSVQSGVLEDALASAPIEPPLLMPTPLEL